MKNKIKPKKPRNQVQERNPTRESEECTAFRQTEWKIETLFSFGKEREKGEMNTINTGSESWEMLEEDKDIQMVT